MPRTMIIHKFLPISFLLLFLFSAIGCGSGSGSSNDASAPERVSSQALTGSSLTYEAETLARTSNTTTQATYESGASGGQYVQTTGVQTVGAYIEFALPSMPTGFYNVGILYKANYNRSTVQASVDGVDLGPPCDQYSSSVIYQVSYGFGNKFFTAGNHTIRFTAIGKNVNSADYLQVIDQIALTLVVNSNDNPTYEAETLARTSNTTTQATYESGASNSQYVQTTGTQTVGEYIDFILPNVPAGAYDVSILYKANYNRATVQASIDGVNQGPPCDQYSSSVIYQVPCNLGSKPLIAGSHTIRFTVIGKNANSADYLEVIDRIALSRSVVTYPTPPGATQSSLYTITANGTPLFVEQLTKFSPEMMVHYAHCSLGAGMTSVTFAVTVSQTFSSYSVSPKSRNLTSTQSGNTVTFGSGDNYLILQFDTKELLFIFIDKAEVNPPNATDPNVKNITDYGVDNTGTTLVTGAVQSAIDAASGAVRSILYFPPGRYKVGELWLKSNMSVYLAGGAILYGSGTTADFNTGSGGINIEGCSHGMIRMYQVTNTKVFGRGVIDGNGKAIRAQNDTKINLFKIEQSTSITVDGIVVRDSSFWDTLIYRSDSVAVRNYKMINCRPTTTASFNNTDGVDFDESTNGTLSNAFLYTGDDNMATKNEEPSGTINTSNIVHDKIVCYSNSVCAKIGTKTMGQTMDGVVFRNIDVVKAGRAMAIDAYDTALVRGTLYENVRVEAADYGLIYLDSDQPPSWRTVANTSVVQDTYFTNIASDVRQTVNLHGKSSTVNINGVHFSNFTVRGNPVTSQTDSDALWDINPYVTNITFQ